MASIFCWVIRSSVCASLVTLAGCSFDAAPEGAPAEDPDFVASEVTGSSSFIEYNRGLVRLDFEQGGGCSGVFVAPNVIATAAHCVYDATVTGTHEGIWNGMKWGNIDVRVVYKPSSTETMCINRSCRNTSGGKLYMRTLAFWEDDFTSVSGNGHYNDVAFLASTLDYLSRPEVEGGPAVGALNIGDYMRILGVSLPIPSGPRPGNNEWPGWVWGYGAPADGQSTVEPRQGLLLMDRWGTYDIEAEYRQSGPYSSAFCAGDSGGPITFSTGIGGRIYVAGVTSKTSSRDGKCPEFGDRLYWARLSPKIGMINHILSWSNRSACQQFTDSDYPNGGTYYRCW